VASALFPFFSRNLNTGGHNEKGTKYVIAQQTIYHSQTVKSGMSRHAFSDILTCHVLFRKILRQ
jgi:predicted acyl esterase